MFKTLITFLLVFVLTLHVQAQSVGLVLSGGGAKGIAHLGVMKAMREHGIEATFVSGTSAGALAAAFYAAGHEPEEVLEIFKDPNIFKFKGFSWVKPGLLEPEKYLSFIESYFGNISFELLEKDLSIVATDLIRGTIRIFNTGPMLKPLYASCAFPFVFSPVEIEDSLYSDGGIINNFPVELAVESAHHVLGVYVSPLRQIHKNDLNGSLDVLDRVYRISNRYSSLEKTSACTWVINPPELENYGTFTLSKIDCFFFWNFQAISLASPQQRPSCW